LCFYVTSTKYQSYPILQSPDTWLRNKLEEARQAEDFSILHPLLDQSEQHEALTLLVQLFTIIMNKRTANAPSLAENARGFSDAVQIILPLPREGRKVCQFNLQ
jgi:hypothetical protein